MQGLEVHQVGELGRLEVEYGGIGSEKEKKREAGKAKGGTAVSFNDMLHFPEREATARKQRKQEYVRVLFYNTISPLLQQIAFHWSLISQPHGSLTAKTINTHTCIRNKQGL